MRNFLLNEAGKREAEMLKVINSRQSVRAWTEKKVAVSIITKILEAGMNAPSAGNEQRIPGTPYLIV